MQNVSSQSIYYSSELENNAINGNSSSQYYLAKCYDFGLGVECNQEKAFYWYKKSGENGNLQARYMLGKIYENNGTLLQQIGKTKDGVQKVRAVRYPVEGTDMILALSYYESVAVSDNFGNVQYHLSEIYYEGKIIDKDYYKAFTYLKRVVNNPNFNDKEKKGIAMNRLANCYRYGRGTEADMRQCNYWREQAALNGFQDAQDLTGMGVYGKLYLEDGTEYTPSSIIQICTFYKKNEESNDTIHSGITILKSEEKGNFSLPAEYTGEKLVMIVSDEFLPLEFIGTQNMKLTLINSK